MLCDRRSCTKAYHLACLGLGKRPFGGSPPRAPPAGVPGDRGGQPPAEHAMFGWPCVCVCVRVAGGRLGGGMGQSLKQAGPE